MTMRKMRTTTTLCDFLGACSMLLSPFLCLDAKGGGSSSSRSLGGDLHLVWELKHVLLPFLRACASVYFVCELVNLPLSCAL
jgi:hypothetical protein